MRNKGVNTAYNIYQWPRYLTRDLVAAYLGVSVDVFDDEVKAGIWPPARRRGGSGGRLTWDRLLIDQYCDSQSGLGAKILPDAPKDSGKKVVDYDEILRNRLAKRPK